MITPEELYKFLPFAIFLTRDKAEAYDLLHDVYLKIMESPYEEQGKRSAFIKTALYNRYIDYTRSAGHSRRKTLVTEDIERCFQPDYEQKDMDEKARAIIAKCLYFLKPRDKYAWQLYMDGFTQKELADAIEMPITAASAIIFRIKDKIAEAAGRRRQKTSYTEEFWSKICSEHARTGTSARTLSKRYCIAYSKVINKLREANVYVPAKKGRRKIS